MLFRYPDKNLFIFMEPDEAEDPGFLIEFYACQNYFILRHAPDFSLRHYFCAESA